MSQYFKFFTVSAIFLAEIGYTKFLSHGNEVPPHRESFSTFPLEIGSWKGREIGLSQDVVFAVGADDYMMRTYIPKSNESGTFSLPVNLYVGYYETQRKGKTYHSPQNCLPGGGWQITGLSQVEIEAPDWVLMSGGTGQTVVINKALIEKGLEKQLVLYWYQDRGRTVASEYWAKIFLVFDAMTRNRTDGSLVRVMAPVRISEEDTLRELVEFSRAMFPYLKGYLPG